MGPDVLLIIFLVLLNAFFVAAEFAIVKVRSSQVDLKINQGSSRARLVRSIIDNMDGYLSACQLGITIASLVLGFVGEPFMTEMVFEPLFKKFDLEVSEKVIRAISLVTGVGLITIIHMVLGEQVPKTMGIRFSLQTAMLIAWPLKIFNTIFAPFVWIINKLTRMVLRLFGIQMNAEHEEIHSEEELRMLLTESEEGGAIKQSEHELIQNVFEFDDRVVKSILVPRTKISAIDLDIEPK